MDVEIAPCLSTGREFEMGVALFTSGYTNEG